MGQKSNPALLRLGRTNQQWVSCWYNDRNYAAQFLDDYVVYTYIQDCSQQLKRIPPSLFIKRNRGQIQISLFSPRSPRRPFLRSLRNAGRMNRGKVSRRTNHLVFSQLFNSVRSKKLIPIAGFVQDQQHVLLRGKRGNFLGEKAQTLKNGVLLSCVSYSPLMFVYSQLQPPIDSLLTSPIPFYPLNFGCSNFYKSLISTFKSLYRNTTSSMLRKRSTKNTKTEGKRARTPLKNHMEFSIWAQFHYRCKFYLLKCPSIHQNPLFLTSQIVYLLQERISFRQMKHRLIEEASKDITIKGIRILCSGRVAARSKKAQKARRESIQWGETSLNAFSELVHFASKKAQTTFGKIGVKLWICYKQPRQTRFSTLARTKAPQLHTLFSSIK